MIITLEEMKKYLRLELDDTEEDSLILSFLEEAEYFLRKATGFKFETDVPPTARQVIRLLVSHWYDNRAVVTSLNIKPIDYTVRTLVDQITWTHEESDPDGTVSSG